MLLLLVYHQRVKALSNGLTCGLVTYRLVLQRAIDTIWEESICRAYE